MHSNSKKHHQHAVGTHSINTKIQHDIEHQDYSSAAGLLRGRGFNPAVRNNLGVCLIRLGQIDEALQVFRSFILESGGTNERPETSDVARRNFATVLLLKQLPSGAVSVLDNTESQNDKRTLELRGAITQWEKSLGWFHWLNWKINHVAPAHCTFVMPFDLGEFERIPEDKPTDRPDVTLRQAA